jgi:hypothetical protein
MENINEAWQLIKIKMAEQAAFNYEAYEELVDETIEYFRERGKITDEDNDELMRNELLGMWDAAQDNFADKDFN